MKKLGASVIGLAALALASSSCNDGFGSVPGKRRLVVTLCDPSGKCDVTPSNVGTLANRLPLPLEAPVPFKIMVQAFLPDGTVDSGFNGFVRVSAKPGAIAPLVGQGTEGRNVQLKNGVSAVVDVQLADAFGTSFLVADDLGYVPADPLRTPPPQCSDGVDNNGNGLIDFPADPGCAFANDDTEDGGTYEQAVSQPIFFQLPRIADVRGIRCSAGTCAGTGQTPYPREPLLIDTGYHDLPGGPHPNGPGFDFDVVVTRISGSGFFFTDLSDDQRVGNGVITGFNSLFAYNFNPPPNMRVCDRLKSVAGTASEFYGFTQLSYPTWTLDEWDPQVRPCLVPEPLVLKAGDLADPTQFTANLLKLSASLVRVQTTPDRTQLAHVGGKLGPGNVPKVNGAYVPDVDATNCDFNKDNKIDFSTGSEEGACSQACTADLECIEYSNFKARSQFRIVVTDVNGTKGYIQADASASGTFDPVHARGQELRAFTGTLTYFWGGNQFTIEARCDQDIIPDVKAEPLPSDKACVLPRTPLELNPE